LFDDTTTHNSESATAVATETEPTAAESTSTDHNVIEQGSNEKSFTQQNSTEHEPAPTATVDPPAPATPASTEEAPHAGQAAADKHASEDFASALENFTTESEEAVGEDRVIKGTVLKLTATHVVVDIGTKCLITRASRR